MQLSPGERFAVVRQLDNPNDGGTYYVRAYIRDALTDALIETINLTDRGGQRFSNEWSVYSKRSGGFYIAIATLVFTDSGYTTYSDVYGQEIETYLVEQRVVHGGGGGGPGISYKEIRRIVQEVLDGLKLPEMPKIGPILAKEVDRAVRAAEAAERAVSGIEVAPRITVTAPKVSLEPLIEAVGAAAQLHESSARVVSEGHSNMTRLAGALRMRSDELARRMQQTSEAGGSRVDAAVQAAFEDIRGMIATLSEPFVKDAAGRAASGMKERIETIRPTAPVRSHVEMLREMRGGHE